MGSAGFSCIRRTFCWLNIIFLICSCAFLGAGLWLRLSCEDYVTLFPDHVILSANTLIIGLGGLGFIISFLGCCSAFLKLRCCLALYFMLIIMLFLSEFLVGLISFIFRGGLTRVLINELRFGVEKYYNATDRGSLIVPSVAVVWDNLQQSLQCCGVSSYEDWYDIQNWRGKHWVPESCCKNLYDRHLATEGSGDTLMKLDCGRAENPSLWWDKGCATAVQQWLFSKLDIVGAIWLGIVFVQLFGLISSMLLFCTSKKKEDTDSYKSYTQTSIEPTRSWED